MKISFNNFISTPSVPTTHTQKNRVSFGATNSLNKDTFQRNNKEKTLTIKSRLDILYDHQYQLLKVTCNPLDKANIYKKVVNPKTGVTEKVPFEVQIAKSEQGFKKNFHFLHPDTNEEIGFFTINNFLTPKNNYAAQNLLEDLGLLENHYEEGIVGERISIEYLQNNKEDQYGGIGQAADQIAVEYCLKNNIKPNIVSMAALNSHAAHYKRGRRFFKIDKDSLNPDYYEFIKEYGTNDPNVIIKERIEKTPKGKIVDCDDLGNLYMYMPKAIVERYAKLAKENPILH